MEEAWDRFFLQGSGRTNTTDTLILSSPQNLELFTTFNFQQSVIAAPAI